VQERATTWAVSIHDAGPGISTENQALLFKPFQRVHQQSHPNVKGMGLGLSFVATVLHRHGGTIEIDSGKGAGCTFTVVLPHTDITDPPSAPSA
jgi:signal transduction histidine kinase